MRSLWPKDDSINNLVHTSNLTNGLGFIVVVFTILW